MKNPQVGDLLPSGYTVEARYKNLYVLAHSKNPDVPEPYAVWSLNREMDTINGRYFLNPQRAEEEFFGLCIDWYFDGMQED